MPNKNCEVCGTPQAGDGSQPCPNCKVVDSNKPSQKPPMK